MNNSYIPFKSAVSTYKYHKSQKLTVKITVAAFSKEIAQGGFSDHWPIRIKEWINWYLWICQNILPNWSFVIS